MKYFILVILLLAFVYVFVFRSLYGKYKEKKKFEDDDKQEPLNDFQQIIEGVSISDEELKKQIEAEEGIEEGIDEKQQAEIEQPSDQQQQTTEKKSTSKYKRKDRRKTYLYNSIIGKTIIDKNPNNDLTDKK